jgi:hypothetical protein
LVRRNRDEPSEGCEAHHARYEILVGKEEDPMIKHAVVYLLSLSLWVGAARADEPAARRGSRGMMIAGIVLTGVGLTLAAPGAVLVGSGGSCHEVDSYSCGEQGAGVAALSGAALLGFGVSLVATGVPMWVVGQVRLKKARLALAPTSLTARF